MKAHQVGGRSVSLFVAAWLLRHVPAIHHNACSIKIGRRSLNPPEIVILSPMAGAAVLCRRAGVQLHSHPDRVPGNSPNRVEYDCGDPLCFDFVANYCIHIVARKPTNSPTLLTSLADEALAMGLNT